METTFIYSLSDPTTGAIRYVGKTDDPEYRQRTHLRKGITIKSKWVQHLLSKGVTPVLEVLDEVPHAEWMFWEQHWIQVVRGWGFDLVNGDNGGLGHYRLTREVAAKISATLKGRPNMALAKPVKKCDDSGVVLQIFPSLAIAARATGVSHCNIVRSLRIGYRCGGFRWKY